jgi:hypothetical protein
MALLLIKVHGDETNDVRLNSIRMKNNEMQLFLFDEFYLREGEELFSS